jgi:hypothetical protein
MIRVTRRLPLTMYTRPQRMDELLRWLPVFVFAQVIEVPVYVVPLRRVGWRGSRLVLAAFGATALTHPFVWFVFPRLLPRSLWLMVFVSESFAVVIEAAYLRLLGVRRPLGWSFLSNMLSFALGAIGHFTIGWP